MFSKQVCVVGMGYIGLPCAILLAQNGCKVYGYDIDEKKAQCIKDREVKLESELQDIFETEQVQRNFEIISNLKETDIFIIAVPTPIEPRKKTADLTALKNAVSEVAGYVKEGNLLIIESTVPPGTMRNIVIPILESHGLDMTRLFLAHCPERLLPGNIVYEIVNNNRIIGGYTKESAKFAAELYRLFVKGNINLTDDITAEMCKLMENTYRDVNIALANELNDVCKTFNINVKRAIELANLHPRVNLLSPGIGVGGHCLPIDPWFIHEVSPYNSTLINTARHINDERPGKIAAQIRQYVSGNLLQKFLLLGKTYKPETTDVRESPAMEIYGILKSEGYYVSSYDSEIDVEKDLYEEMDDCTYVFILVQHRKMMSELDECLNRFKSSGRKKPEIITF